MPHVNHRRPFALVTGLATAALVLIPAAYASAAATAPVENGAAQVHIALTNEDGGACVPDYDTAPAGPVTFSITNQTAPAIIEVELLSNNRILGEKENLAPGLPTVSFTVTLDGGNYRIYCPGAKHDMQPFTVTGQLAEQPTNSVSELLQEGTRGYAHYVAMNIDAMVTAVGRLQQAIDAGNLDKARALYPEARKFYERIEADVEGFRLPGFEITDNHGSLDYLIDMRASSLDPAVGWHGFHAIERALFKYNEITDKTRQYAADLVKNVGQLDNVAQQLTFRPEDLANGAAALLEEVMSGKITGEEEAFSHYDLVDFAGNVEGAQQAFAFLKPGLQEIDPQLTQHVAQEFAKVQTLLDTYRDDNAPGGFVIYTPQLRHSDANKLSRAIQALQEPLSRIAEKVATAGLL